MSKNNLEELLLSKNGSYFSKRVLIKNLTKLGIIIVLYFYSSVVVLPENVKENAMVYHLRLKIYLNFVWSLSPVRFNHVKILCKILVISAMIAFVNLETF